MTRQGVARVAEVVVTTLVVLGLIRVVVDQLSGILWDLPLALVPILFMWTPVWVLRLRGEDPDDYPLDVPPLSDRRVWSEALKVAGVAIVIVGPLFLVGYHLWQTEIFPRVLTGLCDEGWRATCGLARSASQVHPAWRFPGPGKVALLVAYHLFFVGLPEELYYRGYVQTRLDQVWSPRWTFGGALVGPGLLVTCVVFAFGHSLVAFQWWHFAIFFPSLVFGWMRARTGGVLAGAFFHAWSNVTVGLLDVVYGLQPP